MPESKKPSGTQNPPNASGQPSRPKRRRNNRGGGAAKNTAPTTPAQSQTPKKSEVRQPARAISNVSTSAWQGALSTEPMSAPQPDETLRPELVKRIQHTSAFHVPDSKMLDLLVRAGLETNNTFDPEQLKSQMKDEHFHSFMNLVKASIDTYIKDMQLDPN